MLLLYAADVAPFAVPEHEMRSENPSRKLTKTVNFAKGAERNSFTLLTATLRQSKTSQIVPQPPEIPWFLSPFEMPLHVEASV